MSDSSRKAPSARAGVKIEKLNDSLYRLSNYKNRAAGEVAQFSPGGPWVVFRGRKSMGVFQDLETALTWARVVALGALEEKPQ